MELSNIEVLVREVMDFPQPGIGFKDITPILQNPKAYQAAIDCFVELYKDQNIDVVVGPEARGFIIGAPVAYALGAGFIPVRKPGKLPATTISIEYELEYGKNVLEMHEDAILTGQRVLVVDDLLATGGTAAAAAKLAERLGGEIVSIGFLIELTFLYGRDLLSAYEVKSLIQY